MDKTATEGESTYKLCCLGVEFPVMPLCCVIASQCPTVQVTIIDTKEKINVVNKRWKQNAETEPILEEIIERCSEKNLFLTTDPKTAIRESEMIFIAKNTDDSKKTEADVEDIKEIAMIIAAHMNSNKIIVDRSLLPVRNQRIINEILQQNNPLGIKYQVITNPELSAADEIESMLNPSRVLIGSDKSSEGLDAAGTLASIYSKWVPSDRIVMMNNWSSEISKLVSNALIAQRVSTVSAMSLLCEKINMNLKKVMRLVKECPIINAEGFETTFSYSGPQLEKDLKCLVYMCEQINIPEAANFWRSIITINEEHKKAFKNMIFSTFHFSIKHKKFCIWGVVPKNHSEVISTPAAYLCKVLLGEGAKLIIYDPKAEKRKVAEELMKKCATKWHKSITVVDDPLKGARLTQALVICTNRDEFLQVDFKELHWSMIKPAYIFDGRHFLPKDKLTEIGFIVKTIG